MNIYVYARREAAVYTRDLWISGKIQARFNESAFCSRTTLSVIIARERRGGNNCNVQNTRVDCLRFKFYSEMCTRGERKKRETCTVFNLFPFFILFKLPHFFAGIFDIISFFTICYYRCFIWPHISWIRNTAMVNLSFHSLESVKDIGNNWTEPCDTGCFTYLIFIIYGRVNVKFNLLK